ncbi:MAG: hypothetical protein MJ072_05175, partial [Clostridia bacterium]|nr:hypothetical protein [Clostridia bacterium]
MRIIPRTAKVQIQFFKNISLVDILIALVGVGLEILILMTNIGIVRLFIMVVVLACFIWLYVPFDGQRFYMVFVNLTKYVFSMKRYSVDYTKATNNIEFFIPFKDIADGYIVYEDYYAGVLHIDPREFRLLSGFRQDQIIDQCFGKVIRAVAGKTRASIVKIDKRLSLEKYVALENEKLEILEKLMNAGSISPEEKLARDRIIHDRMDIYKNLSGEKSIMKPFYYLVVYDEDKTVIDDILRNGIVSLQEAGMTSKILNDKELGVFLKYGYTDNFDEKDVEFINDKSEFLHWIIPKEIRFTQKSAIVDGTECFNYTVRNFPLSVVNAWGYQIFNIDDTKVVMNLEPYEK